MNLATEYAISSTGLYGTAPPNSVYLIFILQSSNIILLVFKAKKIVILQSITCMKKKFIYFLGIYIDVVTYQPVQFSVHIFGLLFEFGLKFSQ